MAEKVVYIGADHGGYDMKKDLKEYLSGKGHKVIDLGVFNNDAADYPDIAREVCEKVVEGKGTLGILICGTGTGMNMAANKLPGIRAANCTSESMASLARSHNDANVLCLGGRIIASELAKHIADAFLDTAFSNEERHVRRVSKIEA